MLPTQRLTGDGPLVILAAMNLRMAVAWWRATRKEWVAG